MKNKWKEQSAHDLSITCSLELFAPQRQLLLIKKSHRGSGNPRGRLRKHIAILGEKGNVSFWINEIFQQEMLVN